MQKLMSAVLVMIAITLSGCSQEKAQVKAYLAAMDASQEVMKKTAEEMQESMDGLKNEIAGGTFDPAVIKAKLEPFEKRMADEKAKIEGISVPEKAKTHHGLIVKQYGVAIEVMTKTGPMLDVAKEMADAAAKLKGTKDKKALEAGMKEMKALQEKIVGHQKEVIELANSGKEMDEQAKEERKKLAEMFGLPVPSETPAGGAQPAATKSPAA